MMQMEVSPAENWALARRARQSGARVMLNIAPAGRLPKEILPDIDWLVVNEIEVRMAAAGIGGEGENPRAAGAALAAATGTTVVVTLGAEGAAAFAGKEGWEIGALAAALDAGAALPIALRRGSVAGALACLVRGAQPSLPSAAAIDAALHRLPPARKIAPRRK